MKKILLKKKKNIIIKRGFGDGGLGIGDWGLGPIPNPQYKNMNLKYCDLNYYIFYFIK